MSTPLTSFVFLSSIAVLSCGALASHAAASQPLGTAISAPSSQAQIDYQTCFTADIDTPSSRAIRACSKTYKAVRPNSETRAAVMTQRGLLRLSSGDVQHAARDFDKAARLSDDSDSARLALGFAAIYMEDLNTARSRFEDCAQEGASAPLAAYGLGLVALVEGREADARVAFERAAALRPGWTAPQDGLSQLAG